MKEELIDEIKCYLVNKLKVKAKGKNHLCTSYRGKNFVFNFNVDKMLDKRLGIESSDEGDMKKEMYKNLRDDFADDYALEKFINDYFAYRRIAYKDAFNLVERIFDGNGLYVSNNIELYDSIPIDEIERLLNDMLNTVINSKIRDWLVEHYLYAKFEI